MFWFILAPAAAYVRDVFFALIQRDDWHTVQITVFENGMANN